MPLIKAGLMHKGFALDRRHLAVRDVQRPRGLDEELRVHARALPRGRARGLRPAARQIKAAYAEGEAMPVAMHDGSRIVLRKLDQQYDPTSSRQGLRVFREKFQGRRDCDGLLYIDEDPQGHAGADEHGHDAARAAAAESLHPQGQLARILTSYVSNRYSM